MSSTGSGLATPAKGIGPGEDHLPWPILHLPLVTALGVTVLVMAVTLETTTAAAVVTPASTDVRIVVAGLGLLAAVVALVHGRCRQHTRLIDARRIAEDPELAADVYADRDAKGQVAPWLSAWVQAGRMWDLGKAQAFACVLTAATSWLYLSDLGTLTGMLVTALSAGSALLAATVGMFRRLDLVAWARLERDRAAARCCLENLPALAGTRPGGSVLLARLGIAPDSDAHAVAVRLIEEGATGSLAVVAATAKAVAAVPAS